MKEMKMWCCCWKSNYIQNTFNEALLLVELMKGDKLLLLVNMQGKKWKIYGSLG